MSDLEPDLNIGVIEDNFQHDGNVPKFRDKLKTVVNGRNND